MHGAHRFARPPRRCTLVEVCMPPWPTGHAALLCVVPIPPEDLRRASLARTPAPRARPTSRPRRRCRPPPALAMVSRPRYNHIRLWCVCRPIWMLGCHTLQSTPLHSIPPRPTSTTRRYNTRFCMTRRNMTDTTARASPNKPMAEVSTSICMQNLDKDKRASVRSRINAGAIAAVLMSKGWVANGEQT